MLASDRVTIGQLLVVVVTPLPCGRVVTDLTGNLNWRMCGDLVTARVHHRLAVRVVGPVADLVVPPAALLLVLYRVHVVQHHGAVRLTVAGGGDTGWELCVIILRARRSVILRLRRLIQSTSV